MKICRYKKVLLGSHTAHQFIVFESKKLFSVILYYFKSDGWQDRFHTHAFNAISIKLFGTYKVSVRTLLWGRKIAEVNKEDKNDEE